MPLPFARTTAILTFALLHVACSHAVNIGADDRYANCADLGELALQSHSRADAEQRMRLRVLELGGDTLLIGALADQAALYGVLHRIRDLGLALLAVEQLPDPTEYVPP